MKSNTNFRVMPGGYLEARGGFERIKPSGGTAANPITGGIFTGGHEHAMADGYVYVATSGGSSFGSDLSQRAYFDLFQVAAAQNDAIYIGADQKFSRVVFYIGQGEFAAPTAPTFAYEYSTAADLSTFSALTTTSTPTFEDTAGGGSTGEQVLEFADPGTGWIRAALNNRYAYWIRIRITNSPTNLTEKVTQSTQKIQVDWSGTRQIYVSGATASAATNNGELLFYGQVANTAAAWIAVSTSLFSGNYARTRFASYRNILYLVNGKEQKRWDQNTLSDMGFTVPSLSASGAAAAGVGGDFLGTGVWKYAMTYGYGPAGEWGESGYTDIGSAVSTTDGGTESVDLTWTFGSTPASGIVDNIYIYRTPDLSSVPTSARSSVPYYRIKTLTRSSAGALPTSTTDSTLPFPFPPVDLNIATMTPPTRCKFITTHKNRIFLASNNQFAGRVWWSDPFQVEAFNTDENFADFTRSTGGQVTGMIEFNDQVVVFTEDQMFGIANVDQDVPSIYTIHPGLGCVAPESVQAGFGYLMWMARNGVYAWDGNEAPVRVSDHTSSAFGKMSLETFGGSRALLHNRMYDTYLIDNKNTQVSTALGYSRYRYDLVTKTWASVGLAGFEKWGPLAVVTAPVGHADAGVRHPLYGQTALAASDLHAYIGEYGTQDNGSNYTMFGDIHFGPTGLESLNVQKVYAYFSVQNSATRPVLTQGSTSEIGDEIGTLNALTPDTATDYDRISAIPAEGTLGTGDIVIRATMTSASGGTAGMDRLLSLGIDAEGSTEMWGKS